MKNFSKKKHTANFFALAWLLLLGSVWGSTIVITKHVVSTGYQPLGLIFWQLALGALLLSIISVFQKTQLPMTWAHIRFTLLWLWLVPLFQTRLPT